MDKRTARRIADALTWARIWSAIPITVFAWYDMTWWVFGLYVAAVFIIGTLSKMQLALHIWRCERPARAEQARA